MTRAEDRMTSEDLEQRWPALQEELIRRGRTWRLPHEELEDAASRALVKVRQRMSGAGGPQPTHLRAYLHRAFLNELAMVRRSAAHRLRSETPEDGIADGARTAEDALEQKQVWSELAECISQLPDRLQRLVAWRYWDGGALGAFGAELGVGNSAVTRMHIKAKSLLHECLAAKGLGPEENHR